MFKAPFSFEGRIRRLEYGLSIIIYVVAYLLLFAVAYSGTTAGAIGALVMVVPMVWFLWAQGAKRCHDVGRSGWWQLIPFYAIYLIFGEGVAGENEYGLDPKNPDQKGYRETTTLDGNMKN